MQGWQSTGHKEHLDSGLETSDSSTGHLHVSLSLSLSLSAVFPNDEEITGDILPLFDVYAQRTLMWLTMGPYFL